MTERSSSLPWLGHRARGFHYRIFVPARMPRAPIGLRLVEVNSIGLVLTKQDFQRSIRSAAPRKAIRTSLPDSDIAHRLSTPTCQTISRVRDGSGPPKRMSQRLYRN